jgi:hypothetical protein
VCDQVGLSDRCFEFSQVCFDNNVKQHSQFNFMQLDFNSCINLKDNVCLYSNNFCESVELCHYVNQVLVVLMMPKILCMITRV